MYTKCFVNNNNDDCVIEISNGLSTRTNVGPNHSILFANISKHVFCLVPYPLYYYYFLGAISCNPQWRDTANKRKLILRSNIVYIIHKSYRYKLYNINVVSGGSTGARAMFPHWLYFLYHIISKDFFLHRCNRYVLDNIKYEIDNYL